LPEPFVHRSARAARLADAGVHKGDKVAFWGCLLGGVIVVPVDYRASPAFLARIARAVAARPALPAIPKGLLRAVEVRLAWTSCKNPSPPRRNPAPPDRRT
jgi:acyl-CoA synthetase (AMP-forming)/AMP-acid ligase II